MAIQIKVIKNGNHTIDPLIILRILFIFLERKLHCLLKFNINGF